MIIRNDIGGNLGIYDPDPNMTMDHNICVTIDEKCPIPRYVGVKQKWVRTPGEYADHNLIERKGPSGMFVSFDPAKLVYDLRLKLGAMAIGFGNPAEAPGRHFRSVARKADRRGRHQHSPGKEAYCSHSLWPTVLAF